MRPGTSDTWLKRLFFAGLWVVGVYAAVGLCFWVRHAMRPMTGAEETAWLLASGALWLTGFVGAPRLAARVHASQRMASWVETLIWLPVGAVALLWVAFSVIARFLV